MKKIIIFLSSVFIFVLTFVFSDLDSFAYDTDFEFPTAGVTISIHTRYDRPDQYTDIYDYEIESIYPIVFISTDGVFMTAVTPLPYGRNRVRGSYYNDNNLPSSLGDWSDWYTTSWQSWSFSVDGVNQSLYRYGSFRYNSSTFSNVIVFNSYASAWNYFNDPENPDNIDNVENEEGRDIINDSLGGPSINWGDNGDPYFGSPSSDIPAPQFVVSGSQSGNITKDVTFLNFEYDSRRQDGKYGIVMSMKWGSENGFNLTHTGGIFQDTYKVTYSELLPFGNLIDVYGVPERESDIKYCPQSFHFTQNSICLDAFDSYLNTYPINSRSVSGPTEFNSLTGVGPIESFKDFLSKPECPYNVLIFTCCYYKKMPDGSFAFGPYSTGTFYPPSQNAIFNMNSKTSNDAGSMNSGYGGGANGQSDNIDGNGPSWNQNWGNNTPDINYGENVDPQALINNISDLFGLIGQMPAFVGQLFVFLPTWLINFISVSIALAIAIGVVKLFIG